MDCYLKVSIAARKKKGKNLWLRYFRQGALLDESPAEARSSLPRRHVGDRSVEDVFELSFPLHSLHSPGFSAALQMLLQHLSGRLALKHPV